MSKMFYIYQLLALAIILFVMITLDHYVQLWWMSRQRVVHHPSTKEERDERLKHINSMRRCAVVNIKSDRR